MTALRLLRRRRPELADGRSLDGTRERAEALRVLLAREGDGLNEFSHGHTGMTMGPGGRLYVSGLLRVIECHSTSTGVPASSWTPRVPTSKSVCNPGGQLSIPAQNGVIRKGPGRADEGVGPDVGNSYVLVARDREQAFAASDRIWGARIACTDNAAYMATECPESLDTVFVYLRSGEETRLPAPQRTLGEVLGELGRNRPSNGVVLPDRSCPTRNQRLCPSLDGRGNIVLMGYHRVIAGAIVDPATGCYAVLRKSTPDPRSGDVKRPEVYATLIRRRQSRGWKRSHDWALQRGLAGAWEIC